MTTLAILVAQCLSFICTKLGISVKDIDAFRISSKLYIIITSKKKISFQSHQIRFWSLEFYQVSLHSLA